MAKTDILTATETYGKAKTAFNISLSQAANAREAAMLGLGADLTSQSGNVITPKRAGELLGGAGLGEGTTMTTGFGEGALPTIQKEQTASVGEAAQALTERGVGGESGLAKQSKLVIGDTGALATQAAVQEAQAKVAEANAGQAAAGMDVVESEAALETTRGKVAQTPKQKAAAAAKAKQAAAKKRGSARAAANAKAVAAGKPKPYAPTGKPTPPPAPRKKR